MTARDAVTEAIYVKVEAEDPVVADRGRAALLRQRLLEPLELRDDRFVWVDLKMSVLTVGAADELAVRWLERVRTPRHPVIAVFASHSPDVRDTLAAVLRAAQQAAYFVWSSPFEEPPQLIGDLTPTQAETVRVLAELKFATSAQFAGRLEQKQNAMLNRLNDVYQKGLVRLDLSTGIRTYIYPLRRAPQLLEDRASGHSRNGVPKLAH